MTISYPRKDISKFLLSTPSSITGACNSEIFYLHEAYDNHSMGYTPFNDERIFRQYIELAAITPEYDGGLIIPDYSYVAENFCTALSVFYGKRFDSHGLIQQHGRGHVPVNVSDNSICNKKLCFNSSEVRSDFGIPLDLANFNKMYNLLVNQEGELKEAQKTFGYAGRFYVQSLRQVEVSPEIAFLSLITVAEILAAHFKYPLDELIDTETRTLLNELKAIPSVGAKLARKVEDRLYGISEGVCKYILECLDDGFFLRGEASAAYERLPKEGIKQRLKAAYNMRSQFVHAGKFQSNWMAVNYLNHNQEIIIGSPVIPDRQVKKMIERSPTFIGMERIIRYSLIKFLIKTKLIEEPLITPSN